MKLQSELNLKAVDTINDVHAYLEAMPRFQHDGKEAAKFDLESFRSFCRAIGDPQQAFPAVHVAGSNGKGSTCTILGSVYRQAGYKAGVYTSPHIRSFNERITVGGNPITDEAMLSFFKEQERQLRRFKLSYFELSTAIAFWYFSRQEVDLAVIEVGLGGRLDATNIIRPEVAVITNISRDHTDILGDTIPDIAAEKGGIIKEGIPLVLGNTGDEARKVLEGIASERNAPVRYAESLNPQYDNGCFLLQYGEEVIRLASKLAHPIQANNIAAAWHVCNLMGNTFAVCREDFRRGVAEFNMAARFEKLVKSRRWYFDGAHNLQAVRAMMKSVDTVGSVEEAVLVLSLMRDKVSPEVLNEFSEFKKIFYHGMDSPRAAGIEAVRSELPGVKQFPVSDTERQSLFEEFKSELVIFAGSFYFYDTVQDWLISSANNR